MLIKIDSSVHQFGLANVSDAHGDYRYYYVADVPHLMIIVTHNSLKLHDLPARVVDASLGWHEGRYGFVRPGNEDKRHSKLTIWSVVSSGSKPRLEETLTQILANAPREA